MRVVSLFSGIGALDLGLHKAGHEILLQCESDPGAQQVLKMQFPGLLLAPDICALPRLPEGTELVAAGFPCTDVSRAGHRQGLEGKSTSLIQHVFRLLRDAQKSHRGVPWVLLENVEGLLDRISGKKPVIAHVADALEALGYSWAHRIVDTAGFGLPHRRKRVLILASLYGDPRDVLLSQGPGYCQGACMQLFNGEQCYLCRECADCEEKDVQYTYAVDLSNAQCGPAVDVVPTIKSQNDRICLFLPNGKAGYLRVEDAERLQGLPEGWTGPCYPIGSPGITAHLASNLQNRDASPREGYRWALLGNAVSVPVAEWIGRALMSPMAHKYITGPSDLPLFAGIARDIGGLCTELNTPILERCPASSLVPHRCGPEETVITPASPLDLQFAALEKACKTPQALTDAGMDRREEAWPRAAWFIKGLGRHAVEDMSEAPVLCPLQSLGTFVSEVGQMPPHSTVSTYLARLAERGFNTYSIIKKAVSCGLRLSPEVTAVVRLKEGLRDVETLGLLAWVETSGGVWWPGEVLDPWHMPPTRKLPRGATAALSPAKHRLSLPGKGADPPARLIIEAADTEEGVQPETHPTPSRTRSSKTDREVFVITYGTRKGMWTSSKRLLPFKQFLLEKQSEGQALIDAKNMQHPKLFKFGVKQATAMSELVSRGSGGGEHAEAIAALAAAQASEANLQVCCGVCEACLANTLSPRRCLVIRACAAAAAGHSGAQIAVLGEAAIGAHVSVWWRLDEKYYDGIIEGFDRMRQRHTVFYDDGDIELIPLWAPNQMVKAITSPQEWPAASRQLQIKREVHKRTADAQRRLAKRAATEVVRAAPQAAPLTDYERKRADNINRNARVLREMGLAA